MCNSNFDQKVSVLDRALAEHKQINNGLLMVL